MPSMLDKQIEWCQKKLKDNKWLIDTETHLMLAGITQHLKELRDLREVLDNKHGRVKEDNHVDPS